MNAIEEIAAKNGMHLRRLIDLPPENESTFRPSSFITRKWLENFRELVKKELKPYILNPPPNVAMYESDGYFRRAVTCTWDMVMERRRQRQREQLEQKRSNYGVIERKPLYVWVFWCPGINGFIFRGWWIYLRGNGRDYHGGGYKGQVDGKLLDDLLRLFPLVERTLFGLDWRDWKTWMIRFVKKYHRGNCCGRRQGKAPVWCEVKGNYVQRILSKTEWNQQ